MGSKGQTNKPALHDLDTNLTSIYEFMFLYLVYLLLLQLGPFSPIFPQNQTQSLMDAVCKQWRLFQNSKLLRQSFNTWHTWHGWRTWCSCGQC